MMPVHVGSQCSFIYILQPVICLLVILSPVAVRDHRIPEEEESAPVSISILGTCLCNINTFGSLVSYSLGWALLSPILVVKQEIIYMFICMHDMCRFHIWQHIPCVNAKFWNNTHCGLNSGCTLFTTLQVLVSWPAGNTYGKSVW